MIRYCDSKLEIVAMFQLDVAAGRMMDEETGPAERGYDLARLESRKGRTQIATTTSSRISWPAGGVSEGIASPSLRKPSRWQRSASRAIARASSRVRPKVTISGNVGNTTAKLPSVCGSK